jgi:hypothetical protein
MGATIAGALKRRLLAAGFTRQPTCPGCSKQFDPSAFTSLGACRPCSDAWERDRAAHFDSIRDAYYGTPEEPVCDPTALGTGPFLPEDRDDA